MKKRYLFFLRHYNDIDNIAPAIYFFLEQDNEHRADVVIYSEDYDFREDDNLRFLAENFGERFTCQWLGSFFGLDVNKHFNRINKGNARRFKSFLKIIKEKIKEQARKHCSFLFKLQRKIKKQITKVNFISQGLADQKRINEKMGLILNKNRYPNLVCFDINRTKPIKGLLEALRYHGIGRVICLPVSPLINYNTLRQYKLFDLRTEEFLELNDYSGIDRLGFVDNNFTDSFNKTFDLLGADSTLRGKTCSLGSIRFCPQWIKIREKRIRPIDLRTEKIKTVFFLSHSKSNVNCKEVEIAIELLKQYSEYEVLVKSHTRDRQHFSKQKIENVHYVDYDSSALINWADVILFWGTSIAIEGYIKNKTMVCLKYVCGNKNLYDKYDAGYVARCRDDLHEFLEIYRKKRTPPRYNKEGICKLLEGDIIPGGDKVIDNYISFMSASELSSCH